MWGSDNGTIAVDRIVKLNINIKWKFTLVSSNFILPILTIQNRYALFVKMGIDMIRTILLQFKFLI